MLTPKWILLYVLVSQLFLYAARVPMHRAIRSIGEAIAGGLSLAAKWFRQLAREMTQRSQELVLDSGREGAEIKIEREFRRIESTFAKDLADFPQLHRKLDDLLTQAEADYKECGTTPPPAPEWGEMLQAVANMPAGNDKVVQKVLEEIRRSVVSGEKRSLEEYRSATAKRHKILGSMSTQWGDIQNTLGGLGKSCKRALESTSRIDGYMERYAEILKQDDGAHRVLTWTTMKTFIISAIVMGVALGGSFINFQLIALPMSELVPAGGRLMGLPVPSIAALVLVLMEIAAGIFVMEMLGITNLFSQLDSLPSSKRRGILFVSFFGLLMLASIESSLAILREQIVEAESLLKQSLAGADGSAAAEAISSNIPLIGQAVLGFILPWILAMFAVTLGYASKFLSHVVYHVTSAVNSLYDVYIVIPLRIEGHFKKRGTDVFDTEAVISGASSRQQTPAVPRKAELHTARTQILRDRVVERSETRDETAEHEVIS
jgi:hypothetical protein